MERMLILKTGQEYAVTGENGKYYICENGIQFRKANADIDYVKEISDPKKEEKDRESITEEELILTEEKETTPKKARRRSSKKKGEDK